LLADSTPGGFSLLDGGYLRSVDKMVQMIVPTVDGGMEKKNMSELRQLNQSTCSMMISKAENAVINKATAGLATRMVPKKCRFNSAKRLVKNMMQRLSQVR
jgi:hypothetical protein